MPYCPMCGKAVEASYRFCPMCGAAQPSTPATLPLTAPQSGQTQLSVSTQKHTGLWYLVPLIFNIIGGIVGYLAIKRDNKPMANRLLIIGIVMFCLGLSTAFIIPFMISSLSPHAQSTQSTTPAPNFTLPEVNGEGLTDQSFTLSSTTGKVVLLEFFEPWCNHCQDMTPTLKSLYSQFSSQSIVFVSVAGPWNESTARDAANFITTEETNWTYVYDGSQIAFHHYNVTQVPSFFVLGKDGRISSSFVGEQTEFTLAAAITAAEYS